jgi:hypothetical protein
MNSEQSTDPESRVGPVVNLTRLRRLRDLHTRLPHFEHVDQVLEHICRDWPELFSEPPLARSSTSDLAVEVKQLQNQVDQLKTGLISNRKIGAACGILMARLKITQHQAFDTLSVASQESNRKLIDVADELLWTGQLPASDAPGRDVTTASTHAAHQNHS